MKTVCSRGCAEQGVYCIERATAAWGAPKAVAMCAPFKNVQDAGPADAHEAAMATQSNELSTPRVVPLAPRLTITGANQGIEFYERAFGARAGYVQLADQFWGVRHDSFGHRWSLATQIEQPSRHEPDSAVKSFRR